MENQALRQKVAEINWKYPFIPQREAILGGKVLERIVDRSDLKIVNPYERQYMLPFIMHPKYGIHRMDKSFFDHQWLAWQGTELETEFGVAPENTIYGLDQLNLFLDSLGMLGNIIKKNYFEIEKEDDDFTEINLGEISFLEKIRIERNCEQHQNQIGGNLPDSAGTEFQNELKITVYPDFECAKRIYMDPPYLQNSVYFDKNKKKYITNNEFQTLEDEKNGRKPVPRFTRLKKLLMIG